jgi:cytochrome c6
MNRNIILLCAALTAAGLMISGCSASKETEKEVRPKAAKEAGPEQAMPRDATSGQEVSPQTGESLKVGEHLFKLHCAICHPGGGNIINPQKPLRKERREAFGVKTAEDIIHLMRNPGPGMSVFDESTISNEDAKKIAEYVLKTF